MELKIFTDSSHYRKLGSWSVLLQTGKSSENLVVSGLCPDYITTAAQGEAYAIFKGVELASRLFPDVKKIKIHTDCLGLQYVIKPEARDQRHPVNRMLQKAILHKLRVCGYSYTVTYVRGHQNSAVSDDALLNNIVDHHAREIRHRNQYLGNSIEVPPLAKLLRVLIPYTKLFHAYVFKALESAHSPLVENSGTL